MSSKLRDMRYELRAKIRDSIWRPVPADDSMVQYLDCSMIVGCRSLPSIDRISFVPADIQRYAPADDCPVSVLYHAIIRRCSTDHLSLVSTPIKSSWIIKEDFLIITIIHL